MRIAILGTGYTGLTTALRLLQRGHEVTLFEKEEAAGGLAGGFKSEGWDWTLEKAYHHWFTSDNSALNLAEELGHKVITVRPQTNILANDNILPLDSPASLLTFPHLPPLDRLRTGATLFYLKYLANPNSLEGTAAMPWIRKYMGKKATDLIWDPLMSGKFGDYKEEAALTWFWARIKKRTPSLAYPDGGFQEFTERLLQKVGSLGAEIMLDSEVSAIGEDHGKCWVKVNGQLLQFDRIVATLPTPVFAKVTEGLPERYIKRVTSIPHLSALNLILILKKPFMGDTYWLNVTDKSFPFLVLAEHTNFMDSKHYGNQHILYIGNYLPHNHPFLKMSAQQILKIYDPYLRKINPDYPKYLILNTLYSLPFAQPVVTTDYPKLIPEFKTPLKNIYLANLSMVYPWDRGTNYAIEMGEKVAELIDQEN